MIRLNKYISLCGAASRRAADTLIAEGRVCVNGETIQDLGRQVQETDIVLLDGKKLYLPVKTVVLVFNKPAGCVCTANDPQKRKTVYDYLPPGYKGLKYVGRLDLQSRGLLLFTNDGELAHRLTHPKYKIYRHYQVWTNKPLSKQAAEKLTQGIDLGDGLEGHAEAVFFESGFTELVLSEGKNREIRKMMQALGYEIEDLKRITYADIDLGDLPQGDYRELSASEVAKIKKFCDLV